MKQRKDKTMKSVFKPKFDENKANLNIWIDKQVKDKLKVGAKKRGMLYGKYVEKLLKRAVQLQDGVKDEEE